MLATVWFTFWLKIKSAQLAVNTGKQLNTGLHPGHYWNISDVTAADLDELTNLVIYYSSVSS